jgi:hypothetical protein
VGELFRHRHELRIPAVRITPTSPEIRAKILATLPAPVTGATSRINPGHTDPLAKQIPITAAAMTHYPPDHLMSGRHGQVRRGCPSLDFIQLGTAYATGVYLEKQLVSVRRRNGNLIQ